MSKTCRACGGGVCEICGGCVAHGECSCVYDQIKAAQHKMHLTAFGVGMLAFFVGIGSGWFLFVR